MLRHVRNRQRYYYYLFHLSLMTVLYLSHTRIFDGPWQLFMRGQSRSVDQRSVILFAKVGCPCPTVGATCDTKGERSVKVWAKAPQFFETDVCANCIVAIFLC